MVQQQALRDFAQAMANYFADTHGKPTWRKEGRHDGFRIVAVKPAVGALTCRGRWHGDPAVGVTRGRRGHTVEP